MAILLNSFITVKASLTKPNTQGTEKESNSLFFSADQNLKNDLNFSKPAKIKNAYDYFKGLFIRSDAVPHNCDSEH